MPVVALDNVEQVVTQIIKGIKINNNGTEDIKRIATAIHSEGFIYICDSRRLTVVQPCQSLVFVVERHNSPYL